MITGVNMSLVPEVEHVSHIAITSIKRVLLCTFVRMPVYFIAHGCDNDQCNVSLTVSFHHLLLKELCCYNR